MVKKKLKYRPKFYLGGATWNGEDRYFEFITKRIWRSSWGSKDDKYRRILEKIQEGDRLAIKKGQGPGNGDIVIRAIGVVLSVDLDEEYCTLYIEWVRTGMNRKVESRGCYSTIHGPYSNHSDADEVDWVNQIFCL